MRGLSRSIIGLCRRHSVGKVGTAPSPWWPPALARWRPSVGRVGSARLPALTRRDTVLMLSVSFHSNRHPDRLSRFFYTTCCNKEKQNKLHSSIPVPCASTKCLDTVNSRMKETNTKKLANEVTDNNSTEAVDVFSPCLILNSSHRDGAIYHHRGLKEDWGIEDRSETRLEPMMFSKATGSLFFARNMLQFISLKLAECSINNDSIQLYGYIATRDDRDCMLNYVLNHSRDDPIITHKGSLIQMTGPKRGIEMDYPVLIEFDLRIKNGGQEEDDLQLIDGAINCHLYSTSKPIIHRIKGSCGAVDMSLAGLEHAVEATIEVLISEVHRGFSLSLQSFVYVWEDYEEIQLFHGTVDQSCGLRRFVVAVSLGDVMVLKFKLGNSSVELRRSFKSELHGCSSRQIKHELANILVKVTWSTI